MGRKKRVAKTRTVQLVAAPSPSSSPASMNWVQGIALFAMGAAIASIVSVMFSKPQAPGLQLSQSAGGNKQDVRTVWQLLDLSDDELDQVDVVELNLAVAIEIPGLEDLSIAEYQQVVDQWTEAIRREMDQGEAEFRKTPEQWENDIRFFRLGLVASYLNQVVGLEYVEDQKTAQQVSYSDPGQLFVHGAINTKTGTCGNMPVLHVAIGRRLGWPVSLATARSHAICRFDDGEAVFNIESTNSGKGGTFSSGTDEDYMKRFRLPKQAVECGSDLSSMSGRQMLGYFISLRARHYADIEKRDLADRDYALARSIFPNHRGTFMAAQQMAEVKGAEIFHSTEPGYPARLRMNRERQYAQHQAEARRISDLNRRNIEIMQQPFQAARQNFQNAPSDPFARPGLPQSSQQSFNNQSPQSW